MTKTANKYSPEVRERAVRMVLEGPNFSLVDTAFAPVFRYFDVFDEVPEIDVLTGSEKS